MKKYSKKTEQYREYEKTHKRIIDIYEDNIILKLPNQIVNK